MRAESWACLVVHDAASGCDKQHTQQVVPCCCASQPQFRCKPGAAYTAASHSGWFYSCCFSALLALYAAALASRVYTAACADLRLHAARTSFSLISSASFLTLTYLSMLSRCCYDTCVRRAA